MLGKVPAMGRRKGRGEKWIQHYSSSHKILLVGEGDFSFSASLAKAFGSATNMVATSYDSKEMLRNKHWSSEEHLEELKGLGCMVLHDIDVHVMNQHWILKTMKFDRIVYNFPHAGHDSFLHERNWCLIEQHKKLLSGFFQSAREMLTDCGEVHVSHRNDDPYNHWELEKLAKRAGLVLKELVEFRKADYPGYHNKRGGGIKSNQTFPLKECFTFKFSLEDFSTMQQNRTSTSGWDDISEPLPMAFSKAKDLAYLKLELLSLNDSSNRVQKATVGRFGKRIMPSEGDVDQLKKKIDKPDSTITKDMVHRQIVNIPHTVNGLKWNVQEPELVPLTDSIERRTGPEAVHKQIANMPHPVNRLKSTVQNALFFPAALGADWTPAAAVSSDGWNVSGDGWDVSGDEGDEWNMSADEWNMSGDGRDASGDGWDAAVAPPIAVPGDGWDAAIAPPIAVPGDGWNVSGDGWDVSGDEGDEWNMSADEWNMSGDGWDASGDGWDAAVAPPIAVPDDGCDAAIAPPIAVPGDGWNVSGDGWDGSGDGWDAAVAPPIAVPGVDWTPAAGVWGDGWDVSGDGWYAPVAPPIATVALSGWE